MPTRGSCGVSGSSIAAIVAAATLTVSAAQAPIGVETVLDRVSARIAEYYDRAQRFMCLERLFVQPVDQDFSPVGFGRTTEYELRVESDVSEQEPQVQVVRQLIKVNGRAPRERDLKDRSACTDANPLSPEPLGFLLPSHRKEYSFVVVGAGKGKDSNALIIDYASPKNSNKGVLVEDPRGYDECFSWNLDASVKGRIWVDGQTFEVLRLDQRLNGMVELRVPDKLQRLHHFDSVIVVERYDTTIRYKNIAFKDPDETVLLPDSIETVVIHRGGLQPTRRQQVFSNYKRFLTGGRIIKE